MEFIHIYLTATDEERKGHGSQLLYRLKQDNPKLTVWASSEKLKFFVKNDFILQIKLGCILQTVILFQIRSKFMSYGFS